MHHFEIKTDVRAHFWPDLQRVKKEEMHLYSIIFSFSKVTDLCGISSGFTVSRFPSGMCAYCVPSEHRPLKFTFAEPEYRERWNTIWWNSLFRARDASAADVELNMTSTLTYGLQSWHKPCLGSPSSVMMGALRINYIVVLFELYRGTSEVLKPCVFAVFFVKGRSHAVVCVIDSRRY